MRELYKISARQLIYGIIYFTVIMGALTAELRLPTSIYYFNDVMVVMLLYFIYLHGKFYERINMRFFPLLTGCLVFILIIGICINGVPLRLVIWATRNTFRFFVFLYAAIIFLDLDDVERIFETLYKFQWVNLALGLYQLKVLGLEQDSLGGIFGHGNGMGLTSFCCLMVAYQICAYFYKKTTLFRLIFVLISSLLLCTLAEEKMFFFEMVIILVSAVFFTGYTNRKIGGVCLGSLGLYGGLQFLKYLLPWSYERVTNLELFLEYGSSTTGGYNISRFGAFTEINEMFFKNNIFYNLFGYGLGNCEFSKYSIFLSDFYKRNGWLNYRWFAHQWMFLETGYLGLILYILIIVGFLIYGQFYSKKMDSQESMYCGTGKIMVVITVISMFCNALVKGDSGYIPFFGIAITGIAVKSCIFRNQEVEEKT